MSDLDASATAAAWSEFCDSIKRAGIEILRTYPQPTAVDRAEGLRYLVQQVQASIQDALIAETGELPLLRVGANTLNKWGLDCADCKTQSVHLDSAGTYRLSGRRGNARLIALQVMVLEPEFVAFASLSEDALGPDPAGNLEVMIAGERPAGWTGPWLEMDPATTTLVIREYFADWDHEEPGSFRVERLDMPPVQPVLTIEGARALLGRAASSFAARPTRWLPFIAPVREHLVNQLVAMPPTDQGLADNIYGSGWFQLGADEALVIELDEPDALLWSFQLANVWSEALDSINHTSSVNGDQAVASSDGRYRIVVAHEDPGVANWLDTVGHPEGVILFRYQQSNNCPQPSAVVVSFTDVRDALPADTAVVTAVERAETIARRRAHAAIRWAP